MRLCKAAIYGSSYLGLLFSMHCRFQVSFFFKICLLILRDKGWERKRKKNTLIRDRLSPACCLLEIEPAIWASALIGMEIEPVIF